MSYFELPAELLSALKNVMSYVYKAHVICFCLFILIRNLSVSMQKRTCVFTVFVYVFTFQLSSLRAYSSDSSTIYVTTFSMLLLQPILGPVVRASSGHQ